MVHLLLTEVVHLSEPARTRFREAQNDYVSDWALIASTLNPKLPPLHVRVAVHAVIAMINDVAISGHPRRYANIMPILTAMALAMLSPHN
jgi:hypothetical protein